MAITLTLERQKENQTLRVGAQFSHTHGCSVCSCRWDCWCEECQHKTGLGVCPWCEASQRGFTNLEMYQHTHDEFAINEKGGCDLCILYAKGRNAQKRLAAQYKEKRMNPNLVRRDFQQKYSFNDSPEMTVTINSSFTVENISDDEQPYMARLQFEDDSAPESALLRILEPSPITVRPTPSTTRKHITDLASHVFTIPARASIDVEWTYCVRTDKKGSDALSFGTPVTGVIILAELLPNMEFIVDPIIPADVATPNRWEFRRTFLTEQHIPIRWYPIG